MGTVDKLNIVSQEMNIYFGILVFISGIIGNLSNLVIFQTLQTFRETTSGFYLTIISIMNTGLMLGSLLIRIISDGFKTNIKGIPSICKIQVALTVYCAMFSFVVLCAATIDQYISMSQFRQHSNQRFAKRLVILTSIIIACYCILFLLYWDAPFEICMIVNPNFIKYTNYFHSPIISAGLPLSIMIVFSSLAFHKSRSFTTKQMHIIRLSRDRQLTAMTLSHAVFFIIVTIPFIVIFAYITIQTNPNTEQIARNNLLFSIAILINYTGYTVSFYALMRVEFRFHE